MTVTDQGGSVKCVETQKIVQANLEGIQWRGTQTDTKGPTPHCAHDIVP
jgi:hypothetical protein